MTENKAPQTKYVSIAELAKMLGVSRITVFNKIKKGQIPAQKIGRSYAVAMDDVEELLSGTDNGILTDTKKMEIQQAVEKVVKEYGQTLKLLGKE